MARPELVASLRERVHVSPQIDEGALALSGGDLRQDRLFRTGLSLDAHEPLDHVAVRNLVQRLAVAVENGENRGVLVLIESVGFGRAATFIQQPEVEKGGLFGQQPAVPIAVQRGYQPQVGLVRVHPGLLRSF